MKQFSSKKNWTLLVNTNDYDENKVSCLSFQLTVQSNIDLRLFK